MKAGRKERMVEKKKLPAKKAAQAVDKKKIAKTKDGKDER